MDLEKILSVDCIEARADYSTKKQVLESVSNLAARNEYLKEYSETQILDALWERERLSSTGLGNGIAIPHCALDIKEFVLGVITLKQAIEFEAIDEKPVQIILFMIAPRHKRNKHIRYLSTLSQMLSDDLNRKKILAAESSLAVKGIFIRHTESVSKSDDETKWTLFNIFVQREEILDEVLTLFTSIADSNITVTDALSASHFLYSKPLFSSLWGDTHNDYCKMIFATVPAVHTNEIIRKCQVLVKDKYNQGLLFTVQDITFHFGNLDI